MLSAPLTSPLFGSLSFPLSGGGGAPLNFVTGVQAAYSVRKLRTAYAGACIRVRRSSNGNETDIGFNPDGTLDTATMLTFCGAGDGFVVTWYDQSGNSRNVTQSTTANQPQIVASGVVNTENGKPALLFNGTTSELRSTTIPTIFTQSQFYLFSVYKNSLAAQDGSNHYMMSQWITTGNNRAWSLRSNNSSTNAKNIAISSDGANSSTIGSFAPATLNQEINDFQIDLNGSPLCKCWLNNTAQLDTATPALNSLNTTNAPISIGGVGGSYYIGQIQELIAIDGVVANRAALVANANAYYGTYLNGLDADYQAVINRAYALGYTRPPIARQTLQNTLVSALKAAGAWTPTGALYVMNAGSQEFSTLNWKNPTGTALTLVNSPSWTVASGANTGGFNSNGTTSYIDVGIAPNAMPNYAQDNAGRFAWLTGTSNGSYIDGVTGGATERWIIDSTSTTMRINQGTAGLNANTASNGTGFKSLNRTSANDVVVINGSTVQDRTATSATRSTSNFTFLASGGSIGSASVRLAIWGAGSNFVSHHAAMKTAFDTYMGAL